MKWTDPITGRMYDYDNLDTRTKKERDRNRLIKKFKPHSVGYKGLTVWWESGIICAPFLPMKVRE